MGMPYTDVMRHAWGFPTRFYLEKRSRSSQRIEYQRHGYRTIGVSSFSGSYDGAWISNSIIVVTVFRKFFNPKVYNFPIGLHIWVICIPSSGKHLHITWTPSLGLHFQVIYILLLCLHMLHKYRGSSSSRLEARQSQREQRHESGPTGAWMQAIGNTRQQKANMKNDKADLMEE